MDTGIVRAKLFQQKTPVNDSTPESDLTARTQRFVELFTAHQRHVYVFIRTQLPNAADVDEVWQATNLLLWKKFGEFQPGTNFRAWALQTARYEVLNFRSRRGGQTLQFSDELLSHLADEQRAMSDTGDARLAALNACLQKLPTADRDLVERRFQAGATGESVAVSLRRTPHSVYRAISRIRRALIDCVQRHLAREEHGV